MTDVVWIALIIAATIFAIFVYVACCIGSFYLLKKDRLLALPDVEWDEVDRCACIGLSVMGPLSLLTSMIPSPKRCK
jgi:amino acid transporter